MPGKTPVVLQPTWVLVLSKRQYSGAERFDCPVMVAVNPVQVLPEICTDAATDGVGRPELKQRGAVVSPQTIALMQ